MDQVSDGKASVWKLNASGGFVSAQSYQASGWLATSYAGVTTGTADAGSVFVGWQTAGGVSL